ncbi:MAG: hypothetical protein INQ03_06315 [Candidatus Heimdallarchaeota archaeon]|nr:hypothetical protein [Candidatus Heimdallarchaeota archaeon]
MDLDGFRENRKEKGIPTEKIDEAIQLLMAFEEYLGKDLKQCSYDEVHHFAGKLIDEKKNSFDNFIYIIWMAYYLNNHEMILASMELIDGYEIMPNFVRRVEEKFGLEMVGKVFDQTQFPLGLHPERKSELMLNALHKFIKEVGEECANQFMELGLRDKYVESYKNPRQEYLDSDNIDAYLLFKREKFIKLLRKHRDEGTLFFTQVIDDEVLEYVNNNPYIESGVRDGERLELAKIPYMTKEFLHAVSDIEKQYYFCHNPWVREAIKQGKQIPVAICHASGGYYKNFWEYVLDHPVEVTLLESVVTGGKTCKFAIKPITGYPEGFEPEIHEECL